jgi:hypothetical protein
LRLCLDLRHADRPLGGTGLCSNRHR